MRFDWIESGLFVHYKNMNYCMVGIHIDSFRCFKNNSFSFTIGQVSCNTEKEFFIDCNRMNIN